MALEISDIVDVSISIQDQAITQAGFGTMLILGPNAAFGDRVREYSNTAGVLEDFAATDAEYLAAVAAFSQTPRPRTLKIGRRDTAVAQVQTLNFSGDLVTGNTVDMDVQGVALATITFASDNATTMAALAAALQALPSIATAAVTGSNEITVTAAVAGVAVAITGIVVAGGASQATGSTTVTVENVGVVEDLTAISLEDDNWYALVLVDRTASVVLTAAAYIQSIRKIMISVSSDANILDDTVTTDIASVLANLNYDRSGVMYNADPTDYADAAWFGRCLPEAPGSITWMFKSLVGIVSDKSITTNQRNNALAKNSNLYVRRGGIDMTETGTMASGRFIDVRRGVDWLQAIIQEYVFGALASSNKVPYTSEGIATIELQIRKALEEAVRKSVIAEAPEVFDGQPYLVTVPKIEDIDPADKAIRLLPDVTFNAVLAGAIHRVLVNGVVSL